MSVQEQNIDILSRRQSLLDEMITDDNRHGSGYDNVAIHSVISSVGGLGAAPVARHAACYLFRRRSDGDAGHASCIGE
jgi:hypothetical protein